jgi:hypothetical protein
MIMMVPRAVYPRLRPIASVAGRDVMPPRDTRRGSLLIVVVARLLLLAGGVSLFIAVAASGGQVLNIDWQVLIGP